MMNGHGSACETQISNVFPGEKKSVCGFERLKREQMKTVGHEQTAIENATEITACCFEQREKYRTLLE